VSISKTKRMRDLAPFAGAALFPFALIPLPGPGFDVPLLVAGLALTVLLFAAAVLVPWERLPRGCDALPALGYLAVVALLREAGGGNVSGLGPMVLLPVIWLALYGTPSTLAYAIVGSALVYWVPITLDETGLRYPSSGWRIGTVFVPLMAILGFTVQRLHAQVSGSADRLAQLAHTDQLTGLPNRRAWDIALDAVLRASERAEVHACVALIDVDDFKLVNDRDGHAAGDDVLVRLSEAWLLELRRGDTLARIGGDEFAILLPNCTAEDARHVLERVRAVDARLTSSIGLAEWAGHERATALIHRADSALYDAKREGGNQVAIAPPASHELILPA
jgi:diguanylate cyclase (GGDEF)-like protein